MGNAAGHVVSLTRLQVQEQAADSSGAPPDYEGRIGLDPILCQEHGIFRTFSLLIFTTFYAVLSLPTLFFQFHSSRKDNTHAIDLKEISRAIDSSSHSAEFPEEYGGPGHASTNVME